MRHLPACPLVPNFPEQLSGQVSAIFGLLCQCAAIRVKRATKTHWQNDPGSNRAGDVSDDPAEHLQLYLPSKRPLCPRNNKFMGSLHKPRQTTSYIMYVGKQTLQLVDVAKMSDDNFEWLIKDKFCNLRLLLNYADGCIIIFDTR